MTVRWGGSRIFYQHGGSGSGSGSGSGARGGELSDDGIFALTHHRCMETWGLQATWSLELAPLSLSRYYVHTMVPGVCSVKVGHR